MCRSIKTLHNFKNSIYEEDIPAASSNRSKVDLVFNALQSNERAFARAVGKWRISSSCSELVTTAPAPRSQSKPPRHAQGADRFDPPSKGMAWICARASPSRPSAARAMALKYIWSPTISLP